jgi:hypothetical protein
VGPQEDDDAESGDRQGGTGGPLYGADTPAGPDTGPQPLPLLGLEGGVLLGAAHQLRQLSLEVVHGSFLTSPAR